MIKLIRVYAKSIFLALLLAFLIRTFVIQTFNIPSGSMEPTLLVGDYIFVSKFIYGIRIPYTHQRLFSWVKPQRGDIVVFIYPVDPSKDFIKRVIATEGEKVQIIQNRIYINDRSIPDPWGYFKPVGPAWFLERIENYGPVIVPRNSLFMMGDNRDDSEDSRFWGFLPMQNVLGKAFMIYFSWNAKAESLRGRVRWSRIGQWLGPGYSPATNPSNAEMKPAAEE